MLNPPVLMLDVVLVPIRGLIDTESIVNRAVFVGVKVNTPFDVAAINRSVYVPLAPTAVPVSEPPVIVGVTVPTVHAEMV
jgi:hypothetical protein